MAALTAEQVSQKWSRNGAASGPAMNDGIDSVTEAPTALAAEAVRDGRYEAGVREAVSSGKMERSLEGVSLQDWKDAFKTKGVRNAVAGFSDASSVRRVSRFMGDWLPVARAASVNIRRMPKGGRQNALARISAMLDAAEAFKGTYQRNG